MQAWSSAPARDGEQLRHLLHSDLFSPEVELILVMGPISLWDIGSENLYETKEKPYMFALISTF